MFKLGALCLAASSLVLEAHSFIVLNPSPTLHWISNNTNSSGIAYSGTNYLRFLRNETDPDDVLINAVLVNSTGSPLQHWADISDGVIRGPPGIYYSDIISPGAWDVFVGQTATTGEYTIALVNATAWAASHSLGLDPSVVFYQSPKFNVYEAPATTVQPANNCSLAGGSPVWNASATVESVDTTSQCPPEVLATLTASSSSSATGSPTGGSAASKPSGAASSGERLVFGFTSITLAGVISLGALLAL
ncbi:hypothetical protein GLOTRDRAFT_139616 [Gloeophyllum trabeum ATCC 11539]|uniref:Uncharacterized protein n=1 Tax=Gloeophyllum trabeum (strain ATCC 11539 / FP-39264 / Madison 617) TaxID=670483 RepID=S7Q454_GLOTA|nr:uncharacterized protein GLOTRDRAFT_139616 [Gloeophyllum trabeum ATCC 11539]EPQ54302.1 hypothetical protein GLOTRDRAFT_139616 [Gloeophyllum trabeum ATCC 11539]